VRALSALLPSLALLIGGVSTPAKAAATPPISRDALRWESSEKKSSSKKKTSKKKSKKKKKPTPRVLLGGKFALRLVYDDNIIHYSGDDLILFETETNFGKFSIDQAGDWILRPRLELTAKSKGWGGESVEAMVRLSSWCYVENDVKNNESYQVSLKHGAWGVSNFTLTYYHAPLSYLRNFRDRAPYVSRAVDLQYTDFSYTSNSLALAHWRKLNKKFDGKLELKHSWRYFNQAFMENDNWEWRFGGYLSWKALAFLRVKGEYLYSHVIGRGSDSIGETRHDSDNSDPSYDRDSYRIVLTVSPKWIAPVKSVGLSGQHQIYYFTSEKRLEDDPFHVGRKDKIYRAELTWSTNTVAGPLSLEGGYRYTERTSTAPEATAGEDIGEEKDYTDNRFWIGVVYPF